MTVGWALFIVGMSGLMIASPGLRIVAAYAAGALAVAALAWLAFYDPRNPLDLAIALGYVGVPAILALGSAALIEGGGPAGDRVVFPLVMIPFSLLIGMKAFPNAHGWRAIAAALAPLAVSFGLAWLLAATGRYERLRQRFAKMKRG